MELYNKKYVYFEWDDKLEGKKGFFADTIGSLKADVKDDDRLYFGKVCKNTNKNSISYPFNIDNLNPGRNYQFFYYDPNYEVKKAYNEGKKLQWKYRDEEDWNDWDNDTCPTFFDDTTGYELRVKPETVEYKEPEKDRILTNKELSMWLSKGNGQFLNKRTGLVSCNHVYYFTDDDMEIDYLNIRVRKWEDDNWHEPIYNYCFGDK